MAIKILNLKSYVYNLLLISCLQAPACFAELYQYQTQYMSGEALSVFVQSLFPLEQARVNFQNNRVWINADKNILKQIKSLIKQTDIKRIKLKVQLRYSAGSDKRKARATQSNAPVTEFTISDGESLYFSEQWLRDTRFYQYIEQAFVLTQPQQDGMRLQLEASSLQNNVRININLVTFRQQQSQHFQQNLLLVPGQWQDLAPKIQRYRPAGVQRGTREDQAPRWQIRALKVLN